MCSEHIYCSKSDAEHADELERFKKAAAKVTTQAVSRRKVRHMLLNGSESATFIRMIDAILDWAFDNDQILERVADSKLPWLARHLKHVARWFAPAEPTSNV